MLICDTHGLYIVRVCVCVLNRYRARYSNSPLCINAEPETQNPLSFFLLDTGQQMLKFGLGGRPFHNVEEPQLHTRRWNGYARIALSVRCDLFRNHAPKFG